MHENALGIYVWNETELFWNEITLLNKHRVLLMINLFSVKEGACSYWIPGYALYHWRMPTVIMGLRCMAPRIESIRLARTWTERGRSRTVFPNHAILLQSCRSSHSTSQTPHHTRHVWVSTSHDIHTNLALEDWMLQHLDFQHQSHLLLWQNAPCVVIGRHQNPWAECRLPLCRHLDVSIARRLSGGGTVYHDLGEDRYLPDLDVWCKEITGWFLYLVCCRLTSATSQRNDLKA